MSAELFKESTVAFIGAGAMGTAMIAGMLNQGLLHGDQIIAADPHAEKGHDLMTQYGVRFTTDNLEAARHADILILAVKPQVMERVLSQLRGRIDSVELVLSIVASVKMRTIVTQVLNSRVVRSMPNTPAQIGEGMTVWCATQEVEEKQREQAATLLGALGEQLYVDDERLLDMATALSGSGPAYVFLFMEAMIDAGVRMGFTHRDASKLVMQTIKGSADYIQRSGQHPAILRNQVTSPGGTTAAALYQLERLQFRTAVAEGIWAAYQRAVELGGRDE
ncbi:pyrroline-5-carboxylate reductase [Aggregatilineales bacterium SYSU G02658]